jgi:HK97 gp10 family phage protein
MAAAIVVTGDKAVDRALRELGAKIGNKLARKALRNSAKRTKDYAAENLQNSPSVITGDLIAGLKVRAGKRSRNKISVMVTTTAGTHEDPNFGGAQLEWGTKHVPAEPFLRPSIYDHQEEVRDDVIADVRELINETKAKVL